MNLNLKTVEMELRLYNNTAFKVSNEPNGQCVVYVVQKYIYFESLLITTNLTLYNVMLFSHFFACLF